MKIEMYGRDTCPFCRRARDLAQVLDVDYIYHDVEVDPSAQEQRQLLAEKHDHRTVPMVFVDGQFIGGYDDFAAKFG